MSSPLSGRRCIKTPTRRYTTSAVVNNCPLMPFSDFPKIRPTLPPEYHKIYLPHIQENRRGQSPASRLSTALEGWMHRTVARDARQSNSSLSTLEIGAGTLNH